MNYYQLLGVAQNASMDQISRAYINVCKRYKSTLNYGPDISFETVNAAYKVLSDPEARQLYDDSLITEETNIRNDTVTVAASTEAATQGDWLSKDYTDIKEWVYDFRIPSRPSFVSPVENTFSAPLSNTQRSNTTRQAKSTESVAAASKTHKISMVLWILFAFTIGIPMGTAFLTSFHMDAAMALSYSVIGACAFSIACLKTSPAESASVSKNVRSRRNYSAPTKKIYQNLTPAARRNLMDADFALKCKIWGMPGILDDAIGKFGQHNVDLGAAGEELTAKMLEDLLKIPGTRIFHGLKFPGSTTADVDHAIINGDKIVFIDSKMWAGAHYTWVHPDTIGRVRRKEFKKIHTNFPAAVGYLSQTFSKQQVIAMTIIHSNNRYRVSFDNSRASNVTLTNAPDAIRIIGDWFAKDLTGRIDLDSMQKLEYQLK